MVDHDERGRTITAPLLGLEQDSLFWFLKENHVNQLQHDLRTEIITPNLNVFCETLAADPESKLNEDSYMVLPFGQGRTLFAVLDGASSQKEIAGLAKHGMSGAFYVSHLVGFGFKDSPEYQELSKRSILSAGDIMKTVNNWIFQNMQNVPGVDYEDVLTVPGMAATFALVDFNKNKISIAHVADTVASVVNDDNSISVVTNDLNEKFDKETQMFVEQLCSEYKCSRAQIHKIPEAKEKIKNHLRESFRLKINTQNGCGILNGMPELIKNNLIFENTINIIGKSSSLFLFSDGALLPYKQENVSIKQSVNNFLEDAVGIDDSLLERGGVILSEDVEFNKIPRMKFKDDATVLAIHFNLE